jgi:signal peptidase I
MEHSQYNTNLYILSSIYCAIFIQMEENKLNIEEKTTKQSFFELVRFAVLALIIVLPIRFFVAEPFVVSGSSMVPTFQDRNYLIIDKISYRLSKPKRDDVVVFKYPKDQTKYFIKRIIGLPNETVDIIGNTITIKNSNNTDGFVLDEPYVENKASNTTHFELGDDEYFVMGDNRSGSSDSRVWGAVNKELITGRVFLRLLPINKLNIFPGGYTPIK